jgi:hypothetical protein
MALNELSSGKLRHGVLGQKLSCRGPPSMINIDGNDTDKGSDSESLVGTTSS